MCLSGRESPQTAFPRLPCQASSWWALPTGGPEGGKTGEALVLPCSLALFPLLPVVSEAGQLLRWPFLHAPRPVAEAPPLSLWVQVTSSPPFVRPGPRGGTGCLHFLISGSPHLSLLTAPAHLCKRFAALNLLCVKDLA